jgi:hypothetical protein
MSKLIVCGERSTSSRGHRFPEFAYVALRNRACSQACQSAIAICRSALRERRVPRIFSAFGSRAGPCLPRRQRPRIPPVSARPAARWPDRRIFALPYPGRSEGVQAGQSMQDFATRPRRRPPRCAGPPVHARAVPRHVHRRRPAGAKGGLARYWPGGIAECVAQGRLGSLAGKTSKRGGRFAAHLPVIIGQR